MFGSSKEIAIAIPLKVWQDPQGNPLLIYSEYICEVFISCWIESGTPADYICKVKFNFGWGCRTYNLECLPYEVKENHHSAIYEIENSEWLKESEKFRLECYPEWKSWDKKIYHHYLIKGHDNFVEVLAESYIEETILVEEAKNILPSTYLEYFNQ